MADEPSILAQLFPPAPPHNASIKRKTGAGFAAHPELAEHNGSSAREGVSTKWAAVYALELRGLSHKEIAAALHMTPSGISQIVTDERYITYREQRLDVLDQEFVAMKPLAFAALKSGLQSADENTALRASEQWFKGASYGGFSKTERPSTAVTAEDVARQLMSPQINVQVNVNTANRDGDGPEQS